jgi:hypothetical protein
MHGSVLNYSWPHEAAERVAGGSRVLDSSLAIPLISGGIAGVFCILFICGLIVPRSVVDDQKAEIKELKDALEAERDRANAAVTAATATREILAAIQLGRAMGTGAGPT